MGNATRSVCLNEKMNLPIGYTGWKDLLTFLILINFFEQFVMYKQHLHSLINTRMAENRANCKSCHFRSASTHLLPMNLLKSVYFSLSLFRCVIITTIKQTVSFPEHVLPTLTLFLLRLNMENIQNLSRLSYLHRMFYVHIYISIIW